MSLVELYIKDPIKYFQSNNNGYWYLGYENSVEKGIKRVYKFLSKADYILIGEMEIFDYQSYSDICYIILYKAVSKIEYLEYLYNKQVDNNKKKVKL